MGKVGEYLGVRFEGYNCSRCRFHGGAIEGKSDGDRSRSYNADMKKLTYIQDGDIRSGQPITSSSIWLTNNISQVQANFDFRTINL